MIMSEQKSLKCRMKPKGLSFEEHFYATARISGDKIIESINNQIVGQITIIPGINNYESGYGIYEIREKMGII